MFKPYITEVTQGGYNCFINPSRNNLGRHNASSYLTSFPLYCFYIWWSDRTASCTCLTVQLSTTCCSHAPEIWYNGWNQFQPVYHTIYTSPTQWIKTHHITASSITPPKLNNFNSQDFNHDPFLTYIYISHIILTEIIIFLNFYGVMIQLTTLVDSPPLYCCNKNSTRKLATIVAKTCW
jgi:hypothetical protein